MGCLYVHVTKFVRERLLYIFFERVGKAMWPQLALCQDEYKKKKKKQHRKTTTTTNEVSSILLKQSEERRRPRAQTSRHRLFTSLIL